MKKIVLFSKPDCPSSWGVMQELRARAEAMGLTVLINYDAWTSPPPADAPTMAEMGQADVGIAVGGDGTMLGMVRSLMDANLPVIGVNRGTLGYLTEVSAANIQYMLDELVAGRYSIEKRILLGATVDGVHHLAFNDVVLHGQGRLVEYDVFENGKALMTLRADGLIIATPTGSTAYALSANGPILHPSLAALALVPITPHSLSARPITLPSTGTITVTVRGRSGSRLDCDGISHNELLGDGKEVTIQTAKREVSFLHLRDYDLYRTLREKLNWGEPRRG